MPAIAMNNAMKYPARKNAIPCATAYCILSAVFPPRFLARTQPRVIPIMAPIIPNIIEFPHVFAVVSNIVRDIRAFWSNAQWPLSSDGLYRLARTAPHGDVYLHNIGHRCRYRYLKYLMNGVSLPTRSYNRRPASLKSCVSQ